MNTLTERALRAILATVDADPHWHTDEDLATAVLDTYDIEFEGDGAPDGGPTLKDVETRQLARLIVGLAKRLHQETTDRVTLVDVSPVELRREFNPCQHFTTRRPDPLADEVVCVDCGESSLDFEGPF